MLILLFGSFFAYILTCLGFLLVLFLGGLVIGGVHTAFFLPSFKGHFPWWLKLQLIVLRALYFALTALMIGWGIVVVVSIGGCVGITVYAAMN